MNSNLKIGDTCFLIKKALPSTFKVEPDSVNDEHLFARIINIVPITGVTTYHLQFLNFCAYYTKSRTGINFYEYELQKIDIVDVDIDFLNV